MINRHWNLPLSLFGAALLMAIAVLHGSGYGDVATSIADSNLPDWLKRVLPTLFLYPSALLAILAAVVLVTLRFPGGRPAVLLVVAAIVAANSILGFVLGGLIPGGVLLVVATVFWVLSRLAANAS